MHTALEPTNRDDRIVVLDFMRGIAVLGILLMNITGFGLPQAYDDPTNWGGHEGANLLVWRINALLFEGTMRGLFTLLFGASALLFLQRHTTNSSDLRPADLYFRRTLWLIVFGLVNGYLLLWDGDILFYYGVVGLLLFVFRNMTPRRLLIIAAAIMALQTLVTVVEWVGYHDIQEAAQAAEAKKEAGISLNADEEESIETFAATNQDFKPDRSDLESMVASIGASYRSAFKTISERTWYVQTHFFFRHGLLECLGMMLLGMALFKLGVLTGEASTRTYVAMIVLGYAVGFSVNAMEVRELERAGFATQALVMSYLTYDLGRIPMTLGHVGLIVVAYRMQLSPAAIRSLCAVGQMALTNYLAQSAIGLFLFTGAGLALYGRIERHDLYYFVAAIWVAQLCWSPLWLRHFRFGPAEWLWRSLTHWKRQPMRRVTAIRNDETPARSAPRRSAAPIPSYPPPPPAYPDDKPSPARGAAPDRRDIEDSPADR